MKIALIGYGRLGKEIEQIALQRKHSIVRIDPHSKEADFASISVESLRGVDIAIDCTQPDAVIDNIGIAASLGVNLVICTTGWYSKMEEVSQIVKKNKIGLIWSGNFSIGMNLFFRMVSHAAQLMDNAEDYDVLMHELHHAKKADSPSGTAEMIGKLILENMKRKDTIVRDRLERPINPNELHLSSTRGGSIPGTHMVLFDSLADTIELTHTARNRQGFALGAVLAAEWIHGKVGLYNIDDFMKGLFGSG